MSRFVMAALAAFAMTWASHGPCRGAELSRAAGGYDSRREGIEHGKIDSDRVPVSDRRSRAQGQGLYAPGYSKERPIPSCTSCMESAAARRNGCATAPGGDPRQPSGVREGGPDDRRSAQRPGRDRCHRPGSDSEAVARFCGIRTGSPQRSDSVHRGVLLREAGPRIRALAGLSMGGGQGAELWSGKPGPFCLGRGILVGPPPPNTKPNTDLLRDPAEIAEESEAALRLVRRPGSPVRHQPARSPGPDGGRDPPCLPRNSGRATRLCGLEEQPLRIAPLAFREPAGLNAGSAGGEMTPVRWLVRGKARA